MCPPPVVFQDHSSLKAAGPHPHRPALHWAPQALTCHPSRSRWGVQRSVRRGPPPPATGNNACSVSSARLPQGTKGGGREGAPLTTGSPAGGPVLISMRFSGSSSSGASSGITTTGLMCSARAEARRKLGGPCRGSGLKLRGAPRPNNQEAPPSADPPATRPPHPHPRQPQRRDREGCSPGGGHWRAQVPRAAGGSGSAA